MIGSEPDKYTATQSGKFRLRSLAIMLAVTSVLLGTAQGHAGGSISSCEEYARDYADAHAGSGDPTGDMVDEGMRGAVVGGAWAGRSGERRGARAGAALSVLDNMGSTPEGWQSLYDMAYQMCINENSPANYRPTRWAARMSRPAAPLRRPPSRSRRCRTERSAPEAAAPDAEAGCFPVVWPVSPWRSAERLLTPGMRQRQLCPVFDHVFQNVV